MVLGMLRRRSRHRSCHLIDAPNVLPRRGMSAGLSACAWPRLKTGAYPAGSVGRSDEGLPKDGHRVGVHGRPAEILVDIIHSYYAIFPFCIEETLHQ